MADEFGPPKDVVDAFAVLEIKQKFAELDKSFVGYVKILCFDETWTAQQRIEMIQNAVTQLRKDQIKAEKEIAKKHNVNL